MNNIGKTLLKFTIVALLIMLTLCMVGCRNAEYYEDKLKEKGYEVVSLGAEQIDEMAGAEFKEKTGENLSDYVYWMVSGIIRPSPLNPYFYRLVFVMKLKSFRDAKEIEAEIKTGEYDVVRRGRIIIFGTYESVNDVLAKY